MTPSTLDLFLLAAGAFGLGLIMLIKSGGLIVDAATSIARRFHVPPLIIGFTVVAFGTSLPELVVSVNAASKGTGGIALGNVIGSNIANILFVLAVSALVAPLIIQDRRSVLRDSVMMGVVTLLLVGMMAAGGITMAGGLIMILFLTAYIIWQIATSQKARTATQEALLEEVTQHPIKYERFAAALPALLAGLLGVTLGAELLIRGTIVGAGILGVPESVIALSAIAIGTSLPELATCIPAARKGHASILIGNILGSNVFNILLILGVTAMVLPLTSDMGEERLMSIDLPIMAGAAFGLIGLLLFRAGVGRVAGLLMLGGYAAYIGHMALTANVTL